MHGLQHSIAALALAALCSLPARADEPLFRQLGAAQGLPSERVYALAQDQHGCLWVGTADGLARFDGSRFEVFHHDPRRPDSLPSNVVQALHADVSGRLWVGLEGGGLVQIEDDGRSIRRGAGTTEQDAGADVWAIASDASGAVYFGGFGTGIVQIDPASGARRVWNAHEGLLSEHILALAKGPDGAIWVGSHGGLQRLVDTRLEGPPGPAEAAPKGPVFALGRQDDALWLGTRNAAYRYAAGAFVAIDGLKPGPVLALVEDAEDALWVGRPAGLELRPAAAEGRTALSRRQLAGQRSVLDLLRDHEDGLWVASDGGGLLHLPARWRRFRSWPVGEDGLATRSPTAAVFDAKGQLWSGGGDGRVERIDPATGIASLVAERGADWPDPRITALLPTADRLWIGTPRGLVLLPAPGSTVPPRMLPAGSELADAPALGPIQVLLADGRGEVWLSAEGGGIERRAADGRLLRRYAESDGLAGLDSGQLRWGPDGALWVAGAQGLQRLDAASDRFDTLAALQGERVFGFAFADDGRLWVARRSGLLWLQRQQGQWRSGGQLPLLAGIEVGGLSIDAAGNLWASSARGLWRIDPARGVARRFGVRDGLPGQEFSDRPLAESADRQRLAALLLQGLVQVDSSQFGARPQPPRLRIEPLQVQRGGQNLRLDAEPAPVLHHDDRELVLSARVASFAEPDAWRYRMRLEPFDPDWVELGHDGRRVLPLLPPGSYRLQLAVAGPDADWQTHSGPELSVLPPWWQRAPARALQIGLLLVLGWLALRLLRQQAQARAAAALAESQRRWALQASEQKSQFLATLAHEIRTPMTGLLGMAELLGRSELDPAQRRHLEAVRRSGDLLRRLLDDALDMARIEAGKLEIRPRPTALVELCRQPAETLRALADSRQIAIRCEFDPQLPARVQVDPERLQQILFNLLGNALKFSAAGEVLLRVANDESPWRLFEVCDHGPGIDAAQRERLLRRFEQVGGEDTARRFGGAGLGLAICSELAQAMGGRIELDAATGGGACVRLLLPLPACDEESAGADPTAGAPASAPAAADDGLDLLLVEDDPLAAEAICGLLAALGHRPRHAAHALAALAELEQGPAAAALLDLDLPGMDGLQLAALLRSRYPQLPLLAVSARSEPGTEQAVADAGFVLLLRKPVDSAALAAALRSCR